ncbi:hypothetical protein HLW95_004951 [Salmonella enterica]|nr:hypothetical protein [Salmonella enterica]
MMTFGVSITDAQGRQWISPLAPPMNLVSRFQWTLHPEGRQQQYINTGVPAHLNSVIFIRQVSGNQTFSGQMVNRGGSWLYEVNTAGSGGFANPVDSVFIVYVFANMVTVSGGWGIQIYDKNGNVAWDARMLPLEVNAYNIPQTDIPVNMGHGVAVMPGLSQWSAWYGYDFYISSFNARGTLIERASTQANDGLYASEREGVINRTCYYINTDIYDTF